MGNKEDAKEIKKLLNSKKKSCSDLPDSPLFLLCVLTIIFPILALFVAFPINGIWGLFGLFTLAVGFFLIEGLHITIQSIFYTIIHFLLIIKPNLFSSAREGTFSNIKRNINFVSLFLIVVTIAYLIILYYQPLINSFEWISNSIFTGYMVWDTYKLAQE
jgi:hypothetical protein